MPTRVAPAVRQRLPARRGDAIDWFFDHYIPYHHRRDWRFAPLRPDLDGVAPACVILAECDPLVDEGLAYADRLRAAGVPVSWSWYRGLTHDFIKMGRALKEAAHGAAGRWPSPALRKPGPHEQRSDFRFFDRLRVRWAEVDMQKIVFNGHYLMYFDTAVAGYWRALAMPYHETMELLQGDLYVRKATLEYLGSARYDDQLRGRHALRAHRQLVDGVHGGVFRGERCWCAASWSMSSPTRPRRPAARCRRRCARCCWASRPASRWSTCSVGTGTTLGREAQAIRSAVFVEEQKHPGRPGVGRADAECVHAVAYNRFGLALATGRCWSTRRARPRSAAWRCCRPCAAAAWAARCSTR
jgi:YbgC/YbaW family acyl-CoA thioester hydrolase